MLYFIVVMIHPIVIMTTAPAKKKVLDEVVQFVANLFDIYSYLLTFLLVY